MSALVPELERSTDHLQRVYSIVSTIHLLANRFPDPAHEEIVAEACRKILNSCRSVRTLGPIVMSKIEIGNCTVQDIMSATGFSRKRVDYVLAWLVDQGYVVARQRPAVGPKGGRQAGLYTLTPSGKRNLVAMVNQMPSIFA